MKYSASVGVGSVMVCALLAACGGSSTETTPPGSSGSGGLESGGAGYTAGGSSAGISQGVSGTTQGVGGNTQGVGGTTQGLAGMGASAGTVGQGGGISSGTCAPFAACGGNVVGTWQVSDLCEGSLALLPDSTCPTATRTLTIGTITGTFTFNADNTTQSNLQESFSESVLYPPSCYTEAQCTQLGAALAAEPIVTRSSCVYDAAAGCKCTLAATVAAASTGTYQVSGVNITLQSSTQSSPETDTFCVSGSTMNIQHVDGSGNVSTLQLTK